MNAHDAPRESNPGEIAYDRAPTSDGWVALVVTETRRKCVAASPITPPRGGSIDFAAMTVDLRLAAGPASCREAGEHQLER
jgi:hypothetical protein